METIENLDQLKGIVFGVYNTLEIKGDIKIESEKDFKVYVDGNHPFFEVTTEFIDYYITPKYENDLPKPNYQPQIHYVRVGDKVEKVVKDMIVEFERIYNSPDPSDTPTKEF